MYECSPCHTHCAAGQSVGPHACTHAHMRIMASSSGYRTRTEFGRIPNSHIQLLFPDFRIMCSQTLNNEDDVTGRSCRRRRNAFWPAQKRMSKTLPHSLGARYPRAAHTSAESYKAVEQRQSAPSRPVPLERLSPLSGT